MISDKDENYYIYTPMNEIRKKLNRLNNAVEAVALIRDKRTLKINVLRVKTSLLMLQKDTTALLRNIDRFENEEDNN